MYTVHVSDRLQKRYRVEITAKGLPPHKSSLSLQLPAWTPGWYVLRSNERNLSNFTAQTPTKSGLRVQQTEARTWSVSTDGAPQVTVSYDLRASDTDFGFFEPYLDNDHGFLPGPTALPYVVGAKDAPCTIRYALPDGWRVASGNTPAPGQAHTFTAPNYDTLIDQPAELGQFTRVDRSLKGVPVSVVLVGGESTRHARWAESVLKIAEAGIKLLGGAPFERFVFIFHFARTDAFSGGLEHLNSTVIRLDPSQLRPTDPESLAIVAHEFVHAWNVKRARPIALGPFDYTRPVPVKELWFAEGVTDYFAPRLLTEAGLAGQRFWLGYQAEQLTQLMTNPARHHVTLEEASLKVWESTEESQGFGGLSYYNKGLVVGLLLDIELRHRTQNQVGLADLLQELLVQCEKNGRGYREEELEQLASKLAKADLSDFFRRALRSTEELPLQTLLAQGGIFAEESVRRLPTLGMTWDFSQGGQARVGSVAAQGPAAQAGLQAGDRVVQLGGQAIETLLGSALSLGRPGQSLSITYQRGEALLRGVVTLGTEEERSYRLRPLSRLTELQAKILASLSGASTLAP